MRNKLSLKRDVDVLDSIINKMDQLSTIDDFNEFENKAKGIFDGLMKFKHIMRSHRKIKFNYIDVFKTEFARYERSYVPTICVFDGIVRLTPIVLLKKASSIVIHSDWSKNPYPDNIEIGNEAIGQAWVDGIEVFSPRHALNHSMNSTIKLLRNWAFKFKNELEKSL